MRKNRANSRKQKKNWGLYLILAAIVAVAFGGYLVQSQINQSSPTNETKSKSFNHKKKIKVNNKKPDVNALFADLIKTHPKPEISDQLNYWLLTGQVVAEVVYDTSSFKYAHVSAAVYTEKQSDGSWLPILVFNFANLYLINKSEEFLKLVLYHEYIHLQQLFTGKVDPEEMSLSPTDYNVAEEKKFQMLQHSYEDDCEAYEAQCLFAIEMGWQKEHEFCLGYVEGGIEKLRQMVHNYYCLNPDFKKYCAGLNKI